MAIKSETIDGIDGRFEADSRQPITADSQSIDVMEPENGIGIYANESRKEGEGEGEGGEGGAGERGGEEEEVNQYWPGNDNVTHKGRGGRGWRSHLIAFDVS